MLLKLLPVYGFFWAIAWWRLDTDFGWHLQAGNYIRANGIPAHDIFTYTARNFSWIDHEWGNDVILSFLYQHGGYLLASVFYAGLWTTAIFIIGRSLGLATLLLATIALLPYAGIRPLVWSLLGFGLLLKLVARGSNKAKLLIPLLFIPWANLHAGFVIGFIYLAYVAITKRSKSWGLVLLACVLASFINAYGPRLYIEIARTLLDPTLHKQIAEWEPLYILVPSWAYIIVWCSGFWLFSKNKISNWYGFDSLLLLAGLSSSRNITLFVIGSMAHTDYYLKKAASMLPKKLSRISKLVLSTIISAAILSIIFGLIISFLPLSPRENAYPVQAATYLEQRGCEGGNLFNDYDYGGYLIWKLPSQPVYIDGRMPSWRDPNGVKYLDTYFNVLKSAKTRQAQFSRYNIRCVLLSRSGTNLPMLKQLKKSGWKTITQSNGAALLIK